jgi:aminodeoxyfutalosine synthase
MLTTGGILLDQLAEKVTAGERISAEEAVLLYTEAPLGLLARLADQLRRRINGNITCYNHNYHIEPTNRCVYNCRFCSYNEHNSSRVWDYTPEEIRRIASSAPATITEIHIVGGVAPGRGTDYYAGLLRTIREVRPEVHLKAYSAIEISYMARIDHISASEVLIRLKDAGLDSIPGGGAEIFNPEIRKKICPEKDDADRWLEIHETAHMLGIPTNATILYGHIEKYSDRVDHMLRLRNLQDKTGGFNAFIPLKYKHSNNPMSAAGEVSVTEDLRNYAVSRIFLDNIPHLKAYWPMIGRDIAQISQHFGVDDLDGTIHDSTSIYSEAGAEDKNPSMDEAALRTLISAAGFVPAERDSVYRPVHQFSS